MSQTKIRLFLVHKSEISKKVTEATNDQDLKFDQMLEISLYEAFAVGYEVNCGKK